MEYRVKDLQKYLIMSYKNPLEALRIIKYFSTFEDKKNLLGKINKGVLPGKKTLYQFTKCNKLGELAGTKYIPYNELASLEKEFEWVSFKLQYFSDEISLYLELKKQYTQLFFKGDYEKALEVIKSINDLTLSFWAIEQELLCLELLNGFEANNEKLSNLAKETNKPMTLILMQFSSDRVNTLNTFNTFQHKMQNFIESLPDNFTKEILGDFINFYYLENYSELNLDGAKKILSFIDMLSFIDIYEGVIKIISILIAYEQIDLKQLEYILGLIPDNIEDFRLNNIKIIYLNDYTFKNLNKEEYIKTAKIIEAYTSNNYLEVQELSKEFIKNCLLNFSIIDILVKNSIYIRGDIDDYFLSKNEWLKKAMQLMKNIYISKEKEKSINELKNIAKLFHGTGLNLEMLAFSKEQRGDDREYESLWKSGTIYSRILTPLRVKFSKNDLLKENLNSVGFVKTMFLIDSVDILGEDFRSLFYKAKNIKREDPEKAIGILKDLKERYSDLNLDINRYEYERIIRELFFIYLKENNIKEALNLFIECYFIDKDIIIRLHSNKLWNKITKRVAEDLNIFKVTILKFILNPTDTYELYVSLNDITRKFKLKLPSDFLNEETFNIDSLGEDKILLFYILENLYKTDVMKHFVYLMPQKRNEERIFVLRYLIDNSFGNIKSKESEIKEIDKFESVQKRIKQIDQKKIFVDTDAIINEFQEVYLDRFKHYLALDKLNLNITYYDTNIMNTLINLDKEIQYEMKSNPKKKIRFILFKEIVLDYYKELTLNKKFGLEKFLSSRIRHGVLENTLTNTLNRYNLLSLKDESDGNEELLNLNRIQQLEEYGIKQNKDKVLQYFNNFSLNIIAIVERVTNWIKVRTLSQPTGTFDYLAYEKDETLMYLYSEFNEIKNFKVFYSKLTDEFWAHTENLLDKIRQDISTTVFEDINKELSDLENNLRSIIYHDQNVEALIGHISRDIRNAQANFRADLNEVCKWMVVRRSNEFHDFEFNELVETSMEIVNKGSSSFSTTEKIDSHLKVKGEYFNYFIDIMTMLYTNAIKHSGFNNLQNLNIETIISEISIEELPKYTDIIEVDYGISVDKMKEIFSNSNGPIVKILVKNNLGSSVDKSRITEKIKERFMVISQKEVPEEMIIGEGGTGILKIFSILEHNISASYYNFYYVMDNKMHAEIIIDFSNLEVSK